MSPTRAFDSFRVFVSLLLVVCLGACSTTKHVALPSPELSAMNLKTHGTKAQVTLRDGRQLEVEGLQVGVESARGEVRRERTLTESGAPASKWQDAEPGSRDLALRSEEIARVQIRTGRGKGGLIGFLSGVVLGGGAGAGIGYAVADAPPSCPPFIGCKPRDSHTDWREIGAAIGSLAGALVLGTLGAVLGSRGKERTYVIERGGNVAQVGDGPLDSATALPALVR